MAASKVLLERIETRELYRTVAQLLECGDIPSGAHMDRRHFTTFCLVWFGFRSVLHENTTFYYFFAWFALALDPSYMKLRHFTTFLLVWLDNRYFLYEKTTYYYFSPCLIWLQIRLA